MLPLLVLLCVTDALRLRGTVTEYRFSTSNYRRFLAATQYCDEDTLKALPRLMQMGSIGWTIAYRKQQLDNTNAQCLYNAFIGKPEQQTVLPLQLLLSHEMLEQQLDRDWEVYKTEMFDLTVALRATVAKELWRRRILGAVGQDPARATNAVVRWAVEEGFLQVFYHFSGYFAAPPNVLDNWTKAIGLLLTHIHALYVNSIHVLPESQELILLRQFVHEPRNPRVYEQLLVDIKQRIADQPDEECPSKLAYWHGKLLYLALTLQPGRLGTDPSPRSMVVVFFTSYSPQHYKFDQLKLLSRPILCQRLLLGPLEGRLEANLEAIGRRPAFLIKFWGTRWMLTRTWKSLQLAYNVFTPPPGVCGWQEVCVALMESGYGGGALYFRFASVLRLRTQAGIVECHDVLSLLKVLPDVLMKESGVFKSTLFGNRLRDHSFIPLWHAIARLFVLGSLHEERDVFKLAPRLWYRLYQMANYTLPTRVALKYSNHNGLNVLVGLLTNTDFFCITNYQFTT
ncbi:hypothetical protein PSACC_02567 [Paramicrosporidium saccamoebae]|uniref:Uncharacterized protein n=1 Tax=Paramicrosporidium saccamoebae TaxID=1246581 RepID=A0A2H9TIP7_9FUNG|nr:hypothetical protein PSACC_02567 [Paramicrosporidium saccamoebae]